MHKITDIQIESDTIEIIYQRPGKTDTNDEIIIDLLHLAEFSGYSVKHLNPYNVLLDGHIMLEDWHPSVSNLYKYVDYIKWIPESKGKHYQSIYFDCVTTC